ncbi:MAG: DUF6338 family protein [Acidimicrobiales bacterium]
MPTTFVGLLISVAFLTPGFLHAAQRRALAPQGERSVLMETTEVVSLSLVTNGCAAALFGIVRSVWPSHTPDLGAILRSGSTYSIDHLPYVVGWGAAVLAGSCLLAIVLARSAWLRGAVSKRLTPVILESSAWCESLNAPDGTYPHAGIEFADGSFLSGRVVWFSTDLEETGDRELVLGPPLVLRAATGVGALDVQRVVVAARDMRRMDVTYITAPEAAAE